MEYNIKMNLEEISNRLVDYNFLIGTYSRTALSRGLPENLRDPSASGNPPILWKPKVHYLIHIPSSILILRQIDPVHAPFNFSKIHFNIILPSKSECSKWSPFLSFSHQHPICTSHFPIRATCPSHLSLLDLITQRVSDEEYRAQSF